MNLKQAITQGAKNPDLDAALGPIQKLLGVTEGDVAGQVFSSTADGDALNDEYWPHATDQERMEALQEYVATEMRYLGVTESVSHQPVIVEQEDEFDPYSDFETMRMLERAGIATYKHRR